MAVSRKTLPASRDTFSEAQPEVTPRQCRRQIQGGQGSLHAILQAGKPHRKHGAKASTLAQAARGDAVQALSPAAHS